MRIWMADNNETVLIHTLDLEHAQHFLERLSAFLILSSSQSFAILCLSQ